MSQRRQRLYRRLDRAERAAIERGLDKNRPGKGSRVESVPEGACARLRGWPHVCNGRDKRRYRCSMPFRCEYSAARAQLLADGELSAAIEAGRDFIMQSVLATALTHGAAPEGAESREWDLNGKKAVLSVKKAVEKAR